jgi:hypothetical protein
MSVPTLIIEVSKEMENKMSKTPYTLFTYTSNGKEVVSAIHALDVRKFLADYPDAKPIR